MKLNKFLLIFFLAFFLGSFIRQPQDNKLYAKVAHGHPTDGTDAKFSGAAEKNPENFVRENTTSQTGPKSEPLFYVARRGDIDSEASSPILGSVVPLGRFADFSSNPSPDILKNRGKQVISAPISNEKVNPGTSLSWTDFDQIHHISNVIEKILDSASKAEEDDLGKPYIQSNPAKGPLEEEVSLRSFANEKSRSFSISSVWSDTSLNWDDSEQELSFFKGAHGENDEEELDLGTEPFFKDTAAAKAYLELFGDLDLTDLVPTKGGTSTHYMDWETGDLSDSENENPISNASLAWDDSEQELSSFKGAHEENDEEELDRSAEPLFKDTAAPAELKSLEKLSAEEKIFFQRLRSTQGAVPPRYMALCYPDESSLKTMPRRHSADSAQHDLHPKIVSRQFTLKEPDFL